MSSARSRGNGDASQIPLLRDIDVIFDTSIFSMNPLSF